MANAGVIAATSSATANSYIASNSGDASLTANLIAIIISIIIFIFIINWLGKGYNGGMKVIFVLYLLVVSMAMFFN